MSYNNKEKKALFTGITIGAIFSAIAVTTGAVIMVNMHDAYETDIQNARTHCGSSANQGQTQIRLKGHIG